MGKRITGLFVATIFVLSGMAIPAMAADEPGTPGEGNCEGQTVRYLAQAGAEEYGIRPGIGNLARANDMSVRDFHALVDAFCAGDYVPE